MTKAETSALGGPHGARFRLLGRKVSPSLWRSLSSAPAHGQKQVPHDCWSADGLRREGLLTHQRAITKAGISHFISRVRVCVCVCVCACTCVRQHTFQRKPFKSGLHYVHTQTLGRRLGNRNERLSFRCQQLRRHTGYGRHCTVRNFYFNCIPLFKEESEYSGIYILLQKKKKKDYSAAKVFCPGMFPPIIS